MSRANAYPVVDGSSVSLAGLKAGARVRLDLSTRRLIGRQEGPSVPAPPCVIAKSQGGILHVSLCGFKDWTEAQIQAWRDLDALEERLDWAADLAPRPLGDCTSGDVRREEDGDPADHYRAVAKERVRSEKAKKQKRREEAILRAKEQAERNKAGRPAYAKDRERRKGGGK